MLAQGWGHSARRVGCAGQRTGLERADKNWWFAPLAVVVPFAGFPCLGTMPHWVMNRVPLIVYERLADYCPHTVHPPKRVGTNKIARGSR
jgi:hypothetical protein